jgi:ABC-type antimicrobial peptide transport system ATPase subunit
MTDEIYARAAEAIFHPSTKETVARIKHDLTRAGLAIVDAGDQERLRELTQTMEGVVHFSDALNFREDRLSKALKQWIDAGRAILARAALPAKEKR